MVCSDAIAAVGFARFISMSFTDRLWEFGWAVVMTEDDRAEAAALVRCDLVIRSDARADVERYMDSLAGVLDGSWRAISAVYFPRPLGAS